MDDARTVAAARRRRSWARRWVAHRSAMHQLARADTGMRAMGIAALAASRGFTALAVEAAARAEVERMWADG